MSSANFLTRISGFLIDWTRVGELAKSGHKYSFTELMPRAFILGSTIFGAVVPYACWNRGEILYTGLGGFIGFTVSHGIIIAPLVLKRIKITNEYKEIKAGLPRGLEAQVAEIERVECKKASQTLGMRLRLIKTLAASTSSTPHLG